MTMNRADIKATLAKNGYSPTLEQVDALALWSAAVTKIVEAAKLNIGVTLTADESRAISYGLGRLLFPEGQ